MKFVDIKGKVCAALHYMEPHPFILFRYNGFGGGFLGFATDIFSRRRIRDECEQTLKLLIIKNKSTREEGGTFVGMVAVWFFLELLIQHLAMEKVFYYVHYIYKGIDVYETRNLMFHCI